MLADSDLRLTGGTNLVFATICDTSSYFAELSPFVWHLTQFFWCDNVRTLLIVNSFIVYKMEITAFRVLGGIVNYQLENNRSI
jgi:hypothetical protein